MSTNAKKKEQRVKPTRRTQKERRDATTTIILDATLHCLSTQGYVMTSIGKISEESGVSRGGLMHHFPSKVDLVAAAFVHFHSKRLERLQGMILDINKNPLPLKERLQIFRSEIEEWFPISIEFLTTSMKDPLLQSAFSLKIEEYMKPMQDGYDALFPEFCETDSKFLPNMMLIIGCFIRGLCIDSISSNDKTLQDDLFSSFVDLVKFVLDSFDQEADAILLNSSLK